MLLFVFVVAATWVACRLFAGRAAFLLVGAMLATAMSANVLVLDHSRASARDRSRCARATGRSGARGQRAKQRSLHNTYFTLPVLVSMLSNHYGWLYQSKHNWLVLRGADAGAALVRHSFVARHKALVQPASGAVGLRGSGRGAQRLRCRLRWSPPPITDRRQRRAGHAGSQ